MLKGEKLLSVVLSSGKSVLVNGNESDIGKRVIVNIKGKKDIGIVVRISDKKVSDVLTGVDFPDKDFPLLPREIVELCFRLKEKYFCTLSDALKLVCPPDFLKLSVKIAKKDEEVFKKLRAGKLFEALSKRKKISLRKAYKICRAEKIQELEKLGAIKIIPEREIKSKESVEKDFRKYVGKSEKVSKNLQLTDEQKKALDEISNNRGVFLIHGATGSGKTEIYLQAIEKENGGAIFLLPEISLTTFLLSRIKERFPDIAVLHSGITKKQRITYWLALRYGITNIVVGARSAIFAPVQNLKTIIIDEEHDQSYKQSPESSTVDVFYDAREIAFMRSEIQGAKVIMGSATPSVEMFHKAKTGEIKLIQLRKRIPGMSFPKVKVIDLKEALTDDFLSFPLSQELREEIQKRIERGENSILLFTRRGWAISVICLTCGYKFRCERCESSLVYHKKEGLLCHWCGMKYNTPERCKNCQSENLEVIGFGTERIEEELKAIFKVPVFRMDSDIIKNEKHARKVLEKFSKTNPSILIGTQMVSKGFDFPSVTLVGVILADTEFIFPDFRADERAFSLLVQVTGRAGRKIEAGNGSENISIIQTYSPDHPIISYALNQSYEKFFEEEIEKRERFELPPFSEIAVLRFSCKDEQKCWNIAEMFHNKLSEIGIAHEPPAKSLRYFVQNSYNVRIILHLKNNEDKKKLGQIFKRSKFFLHGVKIILDISPHNIS